MTSSLIGSYFLKYISKYFLDNHKDDVKDLVLQKVTDDSKYLGINIFIISLSSVTLIIGLACCVFLMLYTQSTDPVTSLTYTAISLVTFGLVALITCFISLKNRVRVYTNLVSINQNVSNYEWLSPLLNELRRERVKMKEQINK